MGKRVRAPHYITGLGDGKVRNDPASVIDRHDHASDKNSLTMDELYSIRISSDPRKTRQQKGEERRRQERHNRGVVPESLNPDNMKMNMPSFRYIRGKAATMDLQDLFPSSSSTAGDAGNEEIFMLASSGGNIPQPNYWTGNSWQYSIMALIAMMGLMVVLFLHLITESSSPHSYHHGTQRSSTSSFSSSSKPYHKQPSHHSLRRRKHKKKIGEWNDNDVSDDCDAPSSTTGYGGGDEGGNGDANNATAAPGATTNPYYYPSATVEGYPKHRRTSSNNSSNFYNDALPQPLMAPSAPNYRSPSNSYSKPILLSSPSPYALSSGLEGFQQHNSSNNNSKSWVGARPLSPVSSFSSLAGTEEPSSSSSSVLPRGQRNTSSSSMRSPSPGKQQPSRGQLLPLPSGVTRGGSNTPSPSRPLLGGSNNSRTSQRSIVWDIDESETPRACANRSVISMSSRGPALQSQELPSFAFPQQIPSMPVLGGGASPPPKKQPRQMEELIMQMESGQLPMQQKGSPKKSDNEQQQHPHNDLMDAQLSSMLKRDVDSTDDQEYDENDPRRNIMHRREHLTWSTDTTSSLLSRSIPFSELSLLEVIGGGGFGQVWKAVWKGTPVAVKVLTGSAQKRERVSRVILEEFAAEINMLKGMRHPNICLYMGACLDPPNRAIVTELAANGSLWDALRLPLQKPYTAGPTNWPINSSLPPKNAWPWELVKRVAYGAARGMTYLHSGRPPVLHRDLKSANLLLDESYTAKVCDFGLSRLKAQQDEHSMTGNCGTLQWMAPEVLADQKYAEPADVYSFGIILWELLTQECPYDGMSAIQCAMAVLTRDQRPEVPAWCPPSLRSLIGSCVQRNPAQRPTFSQVLLTLDQMP